MNKMIAVLSGVVAMTVAGSAAADCDYESHRAGSHNGLVPAYSYSHVVTMPVSQAPHITCEYEAEDIDCEAEGLYGLDCAAKMQRIYVSCVADEVCRAWADGASEDGSVVGMGPLSEAYEGCLGLVRAAGGEY